MGRLRRLSRSTGLVALLALAACSSWLRPRPENAKAGAAPSSEAALALPQPGRSAARPWLVALISVGGLTAQAFEGSPGTPPAMPFLARLAAAGAAGSLQPVAPASHTPANASLVSGRTPAHHHVASERLLTDHGVSAAGYSEASRLEGPSLWSVAGAAGRRVAALGWPTTLGASIAELIPDIGMTPPGLPWLAALGDKATPALLELAKKAGGDDPGTAIPGALRDRVLTDVACALVAAPGPPNLVLLQLSQVRLPVARDGPGTPAVRAALGAADADLARLAGCLSRAGRLAGAALVIVGDHGSFPVHTDLAPNTLLEAAGLIARGSESGALASWNAFARSNGGSAFVYARSTDDALQARRVLRQRADAGGLFRVVSAEELLADGADPQAWFGLEAKPGYLFIDDLGVPFAAPSALRGSGGYLPGRPEMESGFVAWGRGVRSGLRIPWMRQVDVAPTVARLLGVELPDVDGRPVVGMLNVPAAAPQPATEPPAGKGREEDGQ